LRSNDVIIAVNGIDVKWKTKEEVVQLIGQSDATVLLTLVTITAEGAPEPLHSADKDDDATIVSSSDDGMQQAPGTMTSSWRKKKTGDFKFLKGKLAKK